MSPIETIPMVGLPVDEDDEASAAIFIDLSSSLGRPEKGSTAMYCILTNLLFSSQCHASQGRYADLRSNPTLIQSTHACF